MPFHSKILVQDCTVHLVISLLTSAVWTSFSLLVCYDYGSLQEHWWVHWTVWFLDLGLSDTPSWSGGSCALLTSMQQRVTPVVLMSYSCWCCCHHLDIVVSSQFPLVVNKYIFGDRYFEYICIPYTPFCVKKPRDYPNTLDFGWTEPNTAGLILAFLLFLLEHSFSSKE